MDYRSAAPGEFVSAFGVGDAFGGADQAPTRQLHAGVSGSRPPAGTISEKEHDDSRDLLAQYRLDEKRCKNAPLLTENVAAAAYGFCFACS